MALHCECVVSGERGKNPNSLLLPVLFIEFKKPNWHERGGGSWVFTSQYAVQGLSLLPGWRSSQTMPTCYAVGKQTAQGVESALGLPCLWSEKGEGLQNLFDTFELETPITVWGALNGKSYSVAQGHKLWGKSCFFNEVYKSIPIQSPLPLLISEKISEELFLKQKVYFDCGSGKVVNSLLNRLALSGFSPRNPLFVLKATHSSALKAWEDGRTE